MRWHSIFRHRTIKRKVIAISARMRQLVLQLDELGERLWSLPRAADAIAEDITSINDSDPIGTWMESLPFPLGSVLWRYRASGDRREKTESLFDFFEALSEFAVCVLLSALRNDPQEYALLLPTWLGERADPAHGSFGQWVHLGRAMSKHVRRCLSSSEEDRERILGLFRVHRADRLNGVCGTRLFSVLEQVASFRNDYAHGGVEGAATQQQRLEALEACLQQTRDFSAASSMVGGWCAPARIRTQAAPTSTRWPT